MAAGRPVVATALPELERLEPGLLHLCRTSADFVHSLGHAMAESKDVTLSRLRTGWAAKETWGARAEELAKAIS